MYRFFMELFENYHNFFYVFIAFSFVGLLALLYVVSLAWYRFISWRVSRKNGQSGEKKSEIDQRQDEAIAAISKDAKKALELQKELDEMRERLGIPRE